MYIYTCIYIHIYAMGEGCTRTLGVKYYTYISLMTSGFGG